MIGTYQQLHRLSPIDLKENFPGLLRQIRQSGNSIFNPMLYYSNTFTSPNDFRIESLAWHYISSRCGILERQSRFGGVPPFAGRDDDNDLYDGFKELRYLWPVWGQGDLGLFVDCLDVLDRVCDRLGEGGYRKGIYVEVIEMGRLFAPFVTEVAIQLDNWQLANWEMIVWSFLISFYKLTAWMGIRGVEETLREVLFALTPIQRDTIENIAWLYYQNTGDYLAHRVLVVLN